MGVAADFDPRDVARLRGQLRITLRVGSEDSRFQALANPFGAIRESLVFRRSELRTGNTFALRAERSAGDLPRSMAARLKDPGARLEVTLEELPGSSGAGALMVLLEPLDEPLSPQARSYLGAADALAGKSLAVLRNLAGSFDPEVEALPCRTRAESSALLERLQDGDRVVLGLPAEGLPLGSPVLEVISGAGRLGIPLTGIGIAPPWLRALALSGAPTIPASLRSPDLKASAWGCELASPVLRQSTLVLPSRAGNLRSRLTALARAGQGRVFVLRDPGGHREEGIWGDAPALAEELSPERGDRTPWYLVAAPTHLPETEEQASVPSSLLARLLDAGVPIKTLAEATREHFGGSNRKAYRFLLELARADNTEET